MHLDLPEGSTIYADKAYTDYGYEDMLNEDAQFDLVAMRKSNSTRPILPAGGFNRD
jgi:hypothetical protein